MCRTFTTDGTLNVQPRAVRGSTGNDFFQMQAFETAEPGDLAYEGSGSPPIGETGRSVAPRNS